jgi:hypothetical protein
MTVPGTIAPTEQGDAAAGGTTADNPEQDDLSFSAQMPRGAKLVKIGSEYRVIWKLPDELGWAWYSVDSSQLKLLTGSDNPQADINVPSIPAFNRKYGDNHWGNALEIDLDSDDPWQDLTNRIYDQFGFVPGFNRPEIRRLLLQAYFEGWNGSQFQTEFRRTEYYQTTTDAQRAWVGLSQAEKDFRVKQTALGLAQSYLEIWGVRPKGGWQSPEIQRAATRIAAGVMPPEQWEHGQRRAAERSEGTPAANERDERIRQRGQREVTLENLQGQVEDLWRDWMGPIKMPVGFGAKWAKDLFLNKKSQEELEDRLGQLSTSRWQNKPPEIPWNEWASTYKSQVGDILELGTVEDQDPMLRKLLNQGLEGQDAVSAIRHDPRFRRTQGMYRELSSSVAEIGRRFGFVAD